VCRDQSDQVLGQSVYWKTSPFFLSLTHCSYVRLEFRIDHLLRVSKHFRFCTIGISIFTIKYLSKIELFKQLIQIIIRKYILYVVFSKKILYSLTFRNSLWLFEKLRIYKLMCYYLSYNLCISFLFVILFMIGTYLALNSAFLYIGCILYTFPLFCINWYQVYNSDSRAVNSQSYVVG